MGFRVVLAAKSAPAPTSTEQMAAPKATITSPKPSAHPLTVISPVVLLRRIGLPWAFRSIWSDISRRLEAHRSTPAASRSTASSRPCGQRTVVAERAIVAPVKPPLTMRTGSIRPGVVLRPSPVNPRQQRGQLDSAIAREHGLRLSARAIRFDQLLPLTAGPMPSRPLLHLGFPGL